MPPLRGEQDKGIWGQTAGKTHRRLRSATRCAWAASSRLSPSKPEGSLGTDGVGWVERPRRLQALGLPLPGGLTVNLSTSIRSGCAGGNASPRSGKVPIRECAKPAPYEIKGPFRGKQIFFLGALDLCRRPLRHTAYVAAPWVQISFLALHREAVPLEE